MNNVNINDDCERLFSRAAGAKKILMVLKVIFDFSVQNELDFHKEITQKSPQYPKIFRPAAGYLTHRARVPPCSMSQISDPQNPDLVKKKPLENSDPFFQGGAFFLRGGIFSRISPDVADLGRNARSLSHPDLAVWAREDLAVWDRGGSLGWRGPSSLGS